MDAQLRLIPRPKATDGEPEGGRARRSVATPTRPGEAAEAPAQWRIDDSARERGRAGISRAREALRNARRPLPSERHTTAA